ncbi:hypothetical protein P1J78_09190 [Psychromarinibacter sp. C21-152]|uniref:Uncharacterized protein n=1 Tax=Psychromarinibacter sediminicola TaxID=3033385 RepID=A0AAE3NR20_9RHOB|nr:hypothetical protein [Psychromarinibacter sediminicola]MDF0600904.1 hypothetical protein [Psychromarinibacter sediminicola]
MTATIAIVLLGCGCLPLVAAYGLIRPDRKAGRAAGPIRRS